MSDAEKKIIVIGSEGHSGVENVAWTTEDMPNIADYDNVVLDTYSLSALLRKVPRIKIFKGEYRKEKDANFLRKIKSNQESVRERLLHLLHSGGNIYVISSPRERHPISLYSDCNNYEWSPLPIDTVKEQGETIKIVDDSFAHYFQFVKKWSFCFEELEPDYSHVKDIHNFYKGKYYVKPEMEIIAENRYTRPIAIRLWYSLYQFKNESALKEAMASIHSYNYHDKNRVFVSGQIVLLPPPTEIDSREAINVILEDLWDIQQKTPPPEGIDKILLPGEAQLKQEIKEELDKIDKLKTKISGLEERNKEITQFKQLIYETGDPLEDICKMTLRQLGCKTDDSVEDFILTTGDKEAIVEVKGRLKSILREDGAQLAQNRRNYAIQKGKGIRKIKAILLGNPWRLVLPLEERTKKEPFSIHLAEDSDIEDMALVTTVELFRAYCEFLKGNISSDEIIEHLFSGVGQTKLVGE